jgi:large subunit ribosomal protein L32
MPNPTHRHSKARSAKRRTHYKATTPPVCTCENCGEAKLQHRVCPNCGFYNGRSIITPKA